MPAARKHTAGFSLIELMLVISIIGVLAAIAYPRYGNALHRYRADAAARRVAADLGFAQSRARSLSASRSVVFTVSSNSYQLVGETSLTNSSAAYVVDLSGPPYSVSIATASFGGGGTVTFNGFGIPSQSGSVQIKIGSVTKTISVDPDSGLASIQ